MKLRIFSVILFSILCSLYIKSVSAMDFVYDREKAIRLIEYIRTAALSHPDALGVLEETKSAVPRILADYFRSKALGAFRTVTAGAGMLPIDGSAYSATSVPSSVALSGVTGSIGVSPLAKFREPSPASVPAPKPVHQDKKVGIRVDNKFKRKDKQKFVVVCNHKTCGEKVIIAGYKEIIKAEYAARHADFKSWKNFRCSHAGLECSYWKSCASCGYMHKVPKEEVTTVKANASWKCTDNTWNPDQAYCGKRK